MKPWKWPLMRLESCPFKNGKKGTAGSTCIMGIIRSSNGSRAALALTICSASVEAAWLLLFAGTLLLPVYPHTPATHTGHGSSALCQCSSRELPALVMCLSGAEWCGRALANASGCLQRLQPDNHGTSRPACKAAPALCA